MGNVKKMGNNMQQKPFNPRADQAGPSRLRSASSTGKASAKTSGKASARASSKPIGSASSAVGSSKKSTPARPRKSPTRDVAEKNIARMDVKNLHSGKNAQAAPASPRKKPNASPKKHEDGAKKTSWKDFNWLNFRFQMAAMLFVVIWAVLWGRAFYVQLIAGPDLAYQAGKQHTYTELVEGRRGSILDRNGQILARSVECRSVYANPKIASFTQENVTFLAETLGLTPDYVNNQLSQNRSFVWLARKVDDATASKIHAANIQGIGLSREFERVYPFKHLAGQLLGFVGLDNVGLEGLERSFESTLAGINQKNVVQRDATGRAFYMDDNSAVQGKDIHITLDIQIQFIAEDVIAEAVQSAKATWGGVLVVEVETGDVLAWAQYPFFNPNNYRKSSPAQYRNRLAADALEPGSTFKPFLMAAALEEGIITKDTVFNCENGVWKTKYITIRDDGRAYKDLSASKILSYSSNIGVAKIGLELGTAKFHEYLSRLGFGARTGIGVGESRGIVRAPNEWSEVDLMTSAFGQSISTTAIQMAQGYTTLANGGLFKPLRLVIDEDSNHEGTEQRIISEKTAQTVMTMLQNVVDGDGTGSRARINGIRVAGKTGTAQKASAVKNTGYGEGRMASFAGIVPADKPRYVIIVMLDEPSTTTYGGVLAAPVFQKVASRTLAYGGYLPDVVFAQENTATAVSAKNQGKDQNKNKDSKNAKDKKPEVIHAENCMPNVEGMSVRRAMETLAPYGIVPEVRGDGQIIAKQEPAPGTSLDLLDKLEALDAPNVSAENLAADTLLSDNTEKNPVTYPGAVLWLAE